MENKFEKSATLVEISKALGNFQAKVPAVSRDATNPYFKSRYATLEKIIETIRKPLQDNKLSFSQFPSGENELVTILMHESGEYIQSSVQMSPKENTPQGQGSAITYMRRYALSSMLGLATEEDDDGNEATKPAREVAKAPKQPVVAKKPDIKLSISNKVRKLRDGVNRDTIHGMVLELTNLNLVPENFSEIDNRLSVLLEEKTNTQNNG